MNHRAAEDHLCGFCLNTHDSGDVNIPNKLLDNIGLRRILEF